MWPQLIYPSSLLANELESIGRPDDARKVRVKMITYYETAKKSKMDVPLEGLDAISLIRLTSLDEQVKKMASMKLAFPEAEYNKMLKAKFVMLDKITTEAISIAELGSGIGIVRAYRIIVEAHESLRSEMINFTPEGKSPEYISSFQKGMIKTSAPLEKQAEDFRETAIKKIEKENILSTDNGWFFARNTGIVPEYYNEQGNVLMDKAGAK